MSHEGTHTSCGSNAYKRVKCDRCGREFVCQPWDDFYCATEGDHRCEACLLGGSRIAAEILSVVGGQPSVVFEHDGLGAVPDAA